MRISVFSLAQWPILFVFAILVGLVPATALAVGVPDPGLSTVDYPPEAVLCSQPFVVHVVVRDNTGLPVGAATVDILLNVQSGFLDPGQPALVSGITDPAGEAFIFFPQGILGEAVVVLEPLANGIPLDPSIPYLVTQPCVAIAGSGPSEVCLGQQFVYEIDIQNCSNAPADIDLSATVNGLPAVFSGPNFFAGVPAGGLVQTTLLVDCNTPGNMTIQATADLFLADNPQCFAQDNIVSPVDCLDPCMGVELPDGQVCLGDLLELPVMVTNCGSVPLDITLNCFIGGAPLPPMVIPGLPPGLSVEVLLPVICNAPGLTQVECIATGLVPGSPGCETMFVALSQVDCVEACVTASVDDVSACAGAPVEVPITATNCGSTPLDITIDCTVAGISQPAFVFPGVGPGQSVVALLPVVCGAAGNLPVDCNVNAQDPLNPICAAGVQASGTVTCLGDVPAITSVLDVPNDQGRRLRIQWTASCSDWNVPQTSITGYSIWRRIDPIPALSLAGRTGATRPEALPPGDWDYVDTVPAIGLQSYSAIAGTLCDSTIAAGPCLSTFVVVAMTPNPQETYVSTEASGYSLDNLAPSAPGGLMLVSSSTLDWNESEAADFNYFTVYGSGSGTLDGTAVVLGHTVDPTFSVSGSPYVFYHVTATDFAGNEGPSSQVLSSVAVPEPGIVPGAFALYQSRPNPFRSSTLISFDLSEEEHVRLQVFDVTGRLVKTILDETVAPNRYTVPWSGTDDSGARVAPGIYLYRLESPSVSATRKAILVQ